MDILTKKKNKETWSTWRFPIVLLRALNTTFAILYNLISVFHYLKFVLYQNFLMVVSAVANVAMVIGSHKDLFLWNKYLFTSIVM